MSIKYIKIFYNVLNYIYLEVLYSANDAFLKLPCNIDAASLRIKKDLIWSTLEIPSSVDSQVIYIGHEQWI